MILLMNKNSTKANTDFITAPFAMSMLSSVMTQQSNILKIVHKNEPALQSEMKFVMDEPLVCPEGRRPGKYQHVEKLVNIWIVFKQINALRFGTRGTRSSSLVTFIDTMTRYDALALEAVENSRNKFKAWKSDPMSAGEKDRGYLSGGGFALDHTQYPCCPNMKCRHHLMDQPPGNKDVDTENLADLQVYMNLCKGFKLWKQKKGPQPRCLDKNDLLMKMPSAPKVRKKFGR